MLSRLKELVQPIRVGIIGAGHTGKALLHQCGVTPGIECVALADIMVDKAVAACDELGHPHRDVTRLADLNDTIDQGRLGVCQDGELIAQCEAVDVLIEASSSVEGGGRFAKIALEHRIHVIMMNAESDLLFGPYLMHVARNYGVVYSSCDGDQPGVLRRLIDEIQLWGFELVMAGNIKGYLDRYVNPTTIIPEADKRALDYRMCTAYTDGTKLNVEMALVANAYGLATAVPGMYGPRARSIMEVFDLFNLEAIRDEHGAVVDYVLGAEPRGGVFAVGYCDHPLQQFMLDYFPSQLGPGPFYVFNRPYHLCHVEAMQCVAEAFLDGDALLQPTFGFRTNVYCYAKRNLHRGDALDGIGGYTCYGLVENCTENQRCLGLPICLADDVVLNRDISKDERICMADVTWNPDRSEHQMYTMAMRESEVVSQ
jgi:predicted homoserine dehydrogenase-like protein